MSRETDMAEEKKMLDFLSANGINTLEQLKYIFRQCKKETVDEEVVFIKEIKREAASCISQEKLNMLIEASTRNKEILLFNKLSKSTAETSNPLPAVQQSGTTDVPGRCVVNAGCTKKNVTSLPMRYRHTHNQQNHPFQKEKKVPTAAGRYREACQGNANQGHIKYNQYHHHNYHAHNQNTYEGQNITGYNNDHTMATWPHGGGGINSIGHMIPVTQPLALTTVYNVVPQQQWSSATSMAHTGHSGYNNPAQFHLAPQESQHPRTQYMLGRGSMYNPN